MITQQSAYSFLQEELAEIEAQMLETEQLFQRRLTDLPEDQLQAARNLLHYLCLRSIDARQLQDELHRVGLSSLASSESHIRSQIQAVRQLLGHSYSTADAEPCHYAFSSRNQLDNCIRLFGEPADAARPHIMVTFDSPFATDEILIQDLLLKGMNIARINCAHDHEVIWMDMIQNLKNACAVTGKDCKLYFDLAGPKIRTRLIGKGMDAGKVRIQEGDLCWLCEKDALFSMDEIAIESSLPDIIRALKKGDRVFIDDGAISAVVVSVEINKAAIRIKQVSNPKQSIRSGKGMNFPDTNLNIPALTDFDRSCLPFILRHADLIGCSFLRTASDLKEIQQTLQSFNSGQPGMILKIETAAAVQALPELLLQGMQMPPFGVMIARGDLAVEIGFERLSEIQEEILWLCEAAHVPVIWATQVLENLGKSGLATRSEITDAGHAAVAECVMINKGAYVLRVISTLSDVLIKMSSHQKKKRYWFRKLNIADGFLSANRVRPLIRELHR